MKELKYFLMVMLMLPFSLSQGKDASSSLSASTVKVPGVLVPQRSFDYSKIAPHPRLLLKKEEEPALKKSLNANSDLKNIHNHIIKECNKIVDEAPLEHQLKGKRLLAVSNNALKRLYFLSYAYRMTNEKKYLNRAEKEIEAVCSFKDWNPSHFLDVGEMCMAVAIAYDWLYDDLAENIRELARNAIVEKAFTPSYNKSHAWFLNRDNNWNSVCNAGLIFGALAIIDAEKDQSIAIIERSLQSNVLALKAYDPDGNYPEGPGYWNYGTTFQAMLIEALESSVGIDNRLLEFPGFLQTANYMLFAQGPSGYYFNYSDCGRDASPSPVTFWFAKKRNDPSLVFHEISLIKKGAYTSGKSIERVLPNTLIFAKDLDLSTIKPPSQKIYVGHGITPVCIVRTSWDGIQDKYLGIKGGKASTAHAHMDQGTFVYDTGGLRWAMDFGLQNYYSLESKGISIWNMRQNSQRWDVFRYNNLNHNTITINHQRHNIEGEAKITEIYDTNEERGAMLDITPALNLTNELKSATRKATIVNDSYLKIEDTVETNDQRVNLRWNMATPAQATILDDQIITLMQNGRLMQLEVSSNIPFKLAIRPSEKPSSYYCEFGDYKYGEYNAPNKGTTMVGFDTEIPANEKVSFVITLKEAFIQLELKENTFILDAPSPNTASQGSKLFSVSTPIRIGGTGEMYPGKPEWNVFGKTTIKKIWNKSLNFTIHAKRVEPEGLIDAGIDRSNDGRLGVRGGNGNGIDPKEGYIIGLDLRDIDSDVTLNLTGIAFDGVNGNESCTIVNRIDSRKMMTFQAKKRKNEKDVNITPTYSRKFVDISDLNLVLKGGTNYEEILTLFNTSHVGSFRISGFKFTIK